MKSPKRIGEILARIEGDYSASRGMEEQDGWEFAAVNRLFPVVIGHLRRAREFPSRTAMTAEIERHDGIVRKILTWARGDRGAEDPSMLMGHLVCDALDAHMERYERELRARGPAKILEFRRSG